MRIAAIQFDPKLGEIGQNLERILQELAKAAEAGARLVVFPECACRDMGLPVVKRGWSTRSRSRAARWARWLPPVRPIAAIAFLDFWNATAAGSITRVCSPVPKASSERIAKFTCRFWGSICSPTPAIVPSRSTTPAGSRSACTSATTARFPRRLASWRFWVRISWCCRRTGRLTPNARPST